MHRSTSTSAPSGLVVLGTGGHARSCLDVALAAGLTIYGCVGGEPMTAIQADYLGDDSVLDDLFANGLRSCFVAIGDNEVRRKLSQQVVSIGYELASIVAPSAYVSPTATISAGAVLMHGAVVGPYSAIGQSSIVNTRASVDHDCQVADFAHIAPGCHLAGTVTVGEGAFLGVGSSVIPGRSIGGWATVGAGAVVVRDVAAGRTVVGVPANEVRKHFA